MVKGSGGDTQVSVPQNRKGEFEPQVLPKYQPNTNELEEKIIAMYSRGMSTTDIEEMLHDTYRVSISSAAVSTITDKVWPLVEAWQNQPLAQMYTIIYLDALYIKLRREGHIENVAVYTVLRVDLNGYRDVLGHWVSDGTEGTNFWLSDLQISHNFFALESVFSLWQVVLLSGDWLIMGEKLYGRLHLSYPRPFDALGGVRDCALLVN